LSLPKQNYFSGVNEVTDLTQYIRSNKKTPEQGSGAFTNEQKNFVDYFFVESVVFLVLSIVILVESDIAVLVVSVFTVVESVVVDEEPDPQAAKTLTPNTINNFFILKN
jgi:hypothetical protein